MYRKVLSEINHGGKSVPKFADRTIPGVTVNRSYSNVYRILVCNMQNCERRGQKRRTVDTDDIDGGVVEKQMVRHRNSN